jgi:hypothetical protein
MRLTSQLYMASWSIDAKPSLALHHCTQVSRCQALLYLHHCLKSLGAKPLLALHHCIWSLGIKPLLALHSCMVHRSQVLLALHHLAILNYFVLCIIS